MNKIISLLPSATEIVASLGLIDSLVGRSHECDYPPEIKNLPICTAAKLNSQKLSVEIDADVQILLDSTLSIYEVKTDIIEKLEPTHIITQDRCDVCAVSFGDVEKAISQLINSHPQVISLQPHFLADVWSDIDRVAKAFKIDSQPILQQLNSRIDAIETKIKQLDRDSLPTVIALEWTDPLMGIGSWIPELITKAGGRNRLSVKGKNAPYLTWKQLIQTDPDIIIIMPCGFDLDRTKNESKILTKNENWSNLKAVKNKQVCITDGNAYFNRPSPRLVDSLEILAEILHPNLFNFGYRGNGWDYFET